MRKFNVNFEIPSYITVEVEAENEDQARELACENLSIEEYGSKTGFGTTLAIKGEDNRIFIDTDNSGERIESVEEI